MEGKGRVGMFQYLRMLFGELERGEEVELRVMGRRRGDGPTEGGAGTGAGAGVGAGGGPPVECHFFDSIDRAAAWAHFWKEKCDVYVGVCPRRGRNGTTQGVTRVTAIWQDLDFKGGHTLETRREQLHGLPFRPTMVVNTGGGLHVYWLLDRPLRGAEMARASGAMRALAAVLGADNVSDIARILRVPDTLNHKYSPPLQVEVVGYTASNRYTIEQMEWMASGAGEEHRPSRAVVTEEMLKEAAEYKSGSNGAGPLKIENVLNGVPEGERGVTLFKLACKLRRANVPLDVAAKLVVDTARRCRPPYDEQDAAQIVVRVYRRYPAGPGGEEDEAGAMPYALPRAHRAVEEELDEADAAELYEEAQGQTDPEFLPFLGQSGYIVKGWSHLLAGYPRSGKSELLLRLCVEWANLGQRVVYISEEQRPMWHHRVARMGRGWEVRNLRWVFALNRRPESIFRRAFEGDEEVVVIDTMRAFVGIADETDNSKVAQALNPWIAAAREKHKTLVVVHHMRKGAGEYGEGIAGGHALLGLFDIALELLREDRATTRRKIRVYARLLSPPEMVYDLLPDGGMRFLGDPRAIRLADVMERAREVLSSGGGEWMTTKEVYEALEEPKPSLDQLRDALHKLAVQEKIDRDPPVSAGAAAGKTIRWRSGQGSGRGEYDAGGVA